METTYVNSYNVKDIYDIFNKNRVNKISLGTTNEYISYAVGTEYAYIYANESSEKLNEDYIGCAYFKINGDDNNTYNFYRNYSYTYTETVNGNILLNINPILFAYDFVNKTDDSNEFKFNHVNISHNSGTGTVNVFSDITYSIEKENNTSNNYYNEYKISNEDIKNLLGYKTYADFTTYISYSYIKSETPRTGVVHTDGKQRLFNNEYNDIHIWSLKQEDKERISYLNIDENMINNTYSYAYISYGNVFSDNSLLTYIDFKLQYPEGGYVSGTDFTITTENNEHILKEKNNNFYNICYYYTKSENEKITFAENNNKFNYICEHPSIRNNESIIIAYTYIKSENKENVPYSNNDNYNEVKFEKEIYNLPQHLLCNNFKLKIEIPHGTILGGTVGGGGVFCINKISVSPVLNDSDINLNNEYIITTGELKFNVDVKQDNNILYVTSIDENLNHSNLSVYTHIDDTNVGGGYYGTSYAELNFKTNNIYQEYENVNNTTIKRIDIWGWTDIVFYPSGTSEATYPDGMTCSFGVDYSINNGSNTFYTGDFHIIVKQTGGTNQTVNESSSITFYLPNT